MGRADAADLVVQLLNHIIKVKKEGRLSERFASGGDRLLDGLMRLRVDHDDLVGLHGRGERQSICRS